MFSTLHLHKRLTAVDLDIIQPLLVDVYPIVQDLMHHPPLAAQIAGITVQASCVAGDNS